jgi:hypothetical protein
LSWIECCVVIVAAVLFCEFAAEVRASIAVVAGVQIGKRKK